MKNMAHPGRLAWTIILLSSFGLLSLHANPGNGKGGSDKGSSSSGEHAKGPKNARGSGSVDKVKTADARLAKNSKLSSKLQGLFPPDTDLQSAAAGFRNLGQFVAAVHVSHNLGIPFDQLKTEMVDSGQSLGQAIHKLKPGVDQGAESRKAQGEADRDLRQAGLMGK